MEDNKVISNEDVVNFILNIDWMTTKEFCEKYGYPVPMPIGSAIDMAKDMLAVDGFKWHKVMEFAKKARRTQKEAKPSTIGELEKRGEI